MLFFWLLFCFEISRYLPPTGFFGCSPARAEEKSIFHQASNIPQNNISKPPNSLQNAKLETVWDRLGVGVVTPSTNISLHCKTIYFDFNTTGKRENHWSSRLRIWEAHDSSSSPCLPWRALSPFGASQLPFCLGRNSLCGWKYKKAGYGLFFRCCSWSNQPNPWFLIERAISYQSYLCNPQSKVLEQSDFEPSQCLWQLPRAGDLGAIDFHTHKTLWSPKQSSQLSGHGEPVRTCLMQTCICNWQCFLALEPPYLAPLFGTFKCLPGLPQAQTNFKPTLICCFRKDQRLEGIAGRRAQSRACASSIDLKVSTATKGITWEFSWSQHRRTRNNPAKSSVMGTQTLWNSNFRGHWAENTKWNIQKHNRLLDHSWYQSLCPCIGPSRLDFDFEKCLEDLSLACLGTKLKHVTSFSKLFFKTWRSTSWSALSQGTMSMRALSNLCFVGKTVATATSLVSVFSGLFQGFCFGTKQTISC